jgi:acylphosphatase
MSQSKNEKAFFAEIYGKVQNVGFRYATQDKAKQLRLSGWVRNTDYGNVEVFAQGPEEKIDLFLQWLHKGPEYARVDNVDYRAKQIDPNCTDFFIERGSEDY